MEDVQFLSQDHSILLRGLALWYKKTRFPLWLRFNSFFYERFGIKGMKLIGEFWESRGGRVKFLMIASAPKVHDLDTHTQMQWSLPV